MTTQPNPTIDNKSHEYVWELLPWYVNGTLSRQEVSEVDAHLAQCPACQRELARCADTQSAVKTEREQDWAPSHEHFASVLANVDGFEARRGAAPGWREDLRRWFSWLTETPRPARWALAFQGALVVALGSALLVRALLPAEPYQTLTRPGEQASAHNSQLRVVFDDALTEKELRGLLNRIHGSIVQGPSSVGAYTVELNTQAQSAQRAAVAELRGHPKVRLAEPVADAAKP